MSAPPRHTPAMRRLAWFAPLAWFGDLLLLIPAVTHGRDVHPLVGPLFWVGVFCLVAGFVNCMSDWKAARPEEYRETTQAIMWAITIAWVIGKIKD